MSNTVVEEIEAAVNAELDQKVSAVVDVLTSNDREIATAGLALALIVMPPGQVTDLAFAAILRLADQEVAGE